jgi:uncharacterized membrane protein YccC
LSQISQVSRLRLRRLWSSAVSYLAAMIAMFISMYLHLPRPWWVLMTVYVTTQPLAGVMRPKASYRLIGVGVGAAVAVALVPNLENAPPVLSLALALWIGGCLYFAILDRTPRAFGFMLAAYTAAIVGFPYLDQPGDIFQIALDRVEEMVIAIVCATVAHSILLPWDPTAAVSGRVAAFLGDARAWIADAFRGLHGFREDQERRRFASDITELSIISVHLPSDGLSAAVSRRRVGALEDQMSVLLPLASAAEDRLDALRQRGAVSPLLAALMEDVVAWLGAPEPPLSRVAEFQARCRRAAPALSVGADWDALLTASLCQRLSEFIEAYANSFELAESLGEPLRPPSARLGRLLRRQARQPLYRHHSIAALSAGAAAVAVMAYCTFWILTAWPEGSATAAFAAIVSCSFASQDDPTPAIVKYLGFTLLALPVSALYLFVILPMVDGYAVLAAVLAPVLLVMGYVQADPGRSPYALPMLACFIVAMGFLDRFTVDYARFLNVALAQMGGVIVTIGAARLFRSVGADWSARRILRQGWREVAALAAASRSTDEIAWSRRMHDRLGLIASRMAFLEAWEGFRGADALRDLRIGRNVIHLRRVQVSAAQPTLGRLLGNVLAQIAAFYAARASHGRPIAPPLSLLEGIDRALSRLHEASAGETRRQGFLALAGMRRNLFPDAAAYEARDAA